MTRLRYAVSYTRTLAALPLLALSVWTAVAHVALTATAEAVAGAGPPAPPTHAETADERRPA